MNNTRKDNQVTLLARTNWRGRRQLFGIKQADRRHHVYLIGKTGTGKTTLLETMIRQDVKAGRGLALLDPHGDLVEKLAAWIPEHRRSDLIYFDVPSGAGGVGYNPLARVESSRRSMAASGTLEVFKKLWADSWGPRLEHILRNALLALVEQPEATLADVLRLLDDRAYRRRAAERVSNPKVRDFWLREYEAWSVRLRTEAVAPVQNKVGAFLADPVLARILTDHRSSLGLRDVIDGGKILLVNLAKGRLGGDTAALLGALIVSGFGSAALSRTDVPEESRRDFFLYLDEFQSFTTLALAGMLSELRKYRVNLVLAHQYLTQLDVPLRDAILGNVGTIICFRIGLADAEVLEKEFRPEFRAKDLVQLPNYNVYLKLMVDRRVTRAFSAETIKL